MCWDTVTFSCSCRTSCSKPNSGGVRGLEETTPQITFLLWIGHSEVTEQVWGNCCCIDCQSKMTCASSEALIIYAIIHLKFHLGDNEKANLRQMAKLCWFWNFIHTESYQRLHYLMCLAEERSIWIYSLMFRFCLTATPTSQQTWEWFNLFYG